MTACVYIDVHGKQHAVKFQGGVGVHDAENRMRTTFNITGGCISSSDNIAVMSTLDEGVNYYFLSFEETPIAQTGITKGILIPNDVLRKKRTNAITAFPSS